MKTYTSYSTKQTPQSEPIPGKAMVENSAGGYAFAIDDWKRLQRFLILGTEGGTYYTSARKLTKENAECVLRCIKADGIKTVNTIMEISEAGRAPKNDPALFALAMCAGLGDTQTKQYALEKALLKVARIGTHLFHFITYVEQFRGWGRALKRGVKQWYQFKTIDDLAYQAVKYQSRDKWSHRDLLRLAHPQTEDKERNSIYKWVVDAEYVEPVHKLIEGYRLAFAGEVKDKGQHIIDYNLSREMIPTDWLTEKDVWKALLEHMPMTAMIRNLATMTRIGLIAPLAEANKKIITTLTNKDALKKARIHPIALLSALKTYEQGCGERGQNTWNPVSQIVDALNDAFYLSFDAIEPTGKRWMLALDVSGSMDSGNIAGVPSLTPRVASSAMAMATARVESNYNIMAFSQGFIPLSISPKQRLDDICRYTNGLDFEETDCAVPMIWALQKAIPVDVFTIYTDNETWAGNIHPCVALEQYQQKMGIPAKLIVVGMTSTGFSIADSNNEKMLDVVGFDTATPNVMADFATT